MDKLEVLKPEAAQYLRQIDPATYAEAFFPGHRFGHDTQNIAESMNKELLRAREGSTLELLNDVWTKLMVDRFTRYQTALTAQSNGELYTPYCASLVKESRKWAGSYTVRPSSLVTGQAIST